jgi:hypothetical protein
LTQIADTLTPPQAHALRYIAASRRQLLISQHNAQLAALVTVGASVKIRDNLNPKYLRGLTGTVASSDGKVTTVLLDEASTSAMVNQGHGVLADGTTRLSVDGIPGAVLEVLDAPADFVDLVTFMISSASPDDLEQLVDAGDRSIRDLADNVTPGATVMVTNTRPKFLAGLTGTVDSVDAQAGTCLVFLDEESTNRLRYQRSPSYVVPDETTRFPLRLKFEQALVVSRS